jgi:hypothetical protein
MHNGEAADAPVEDRLVDDGAERRRGRAVEDVLPGQLYTAMDVEFDRRARAAWSTAG